MGFFNTGGSEDIFRNVSFILDTPKGSCPLCRDFGVSPALTDLPVNKIAAAVREEAADAVETYEPRVSVKSVDFSGDPYEGSARPAVKAELKDE